MGIANIVNTAGGGGGSSEIITHLVNSVDGAGLRLANQGYISCADVSANRFGTNDFSVEFVLSQETSAVNADIFISNFNSSNQAVDAAVIRWDVVQNDNIQLVFTNSGATETAYNFGYDPAPDLNEPTHYLVSADRSGNAVLYRNGAEIASVSIAASGSANVGNSGQPTVIGSPVNNFGVKGNVYRLRTYSKALSSDEAKNVFDRADVPTALVSNLLLDLDCAYANPTQSTVIQDKGPNNQDGTLNGTITQTNVIKQLNSVSARIGTTAATLADGDIVADKIGVGIAPDANAKLDVNGTIYVRNTSVKGVISNPSGDIFDIANASGGTSNPITFSTQGSERMRIDSTGSVAIGSTDNGVAGSIDLSVGNPGTTTGGITLWSTTSAAHSLGFGDANSGTARYEGYVEYNHSTNAMTLGTLHATRLTIDSSGSVAITGDTDTSTFFGKTLAIADAGNCGIIFKKTTGTTKDFSVGVKSDGTFNVVDGGTPRLTIDTSGAVDIAGAASHATALTVGNSTGGTELQVIPKENESITLNSAEGSTAHALILATGGTPRLTVASTGLATFANGIAFSQTNSSATGATATGTTLDHYEEGTWTPSLSPGSGSFTTLTYTIQRGRYIRVGSQVWCGFELTVNSFTIGTGASYVSLDGLPFARPALEDQYGTGVVTHYSGWTTAAPTLLPRNGAASCILRYGFSATTVTNLSPANITNGCVMHGFVTFSV